MKDSLKATVECHWDDARGKKKIGQIVVTFETTPTRLFKGLRKEETALLGEFLQTPDFPTLKELEKIYLKECKSIALATSMVKGFQFFEFDDEAEKYLQEIKEKWPSELLVHTTEALLRLSMNKELQIPEIFSGHFVLKPCYPRRKIYHYSEAISFHNVWGMYFTSKEKHEKAEKQYYFCKYLIDLSRASLSEKSAG